MPRPRRPTTRASQRHNFRRLNLWGNVLSRLARSWVCLRAPAQRAAAPRRNHALVLFFDLLQASRFLFTGSRLKWLSKEGRTPVWPLLGRGRRGQAWRGGMVVAGSGVLSLAAVGRALGGTPGLLQRALSAKIWWDYNHIFEVEGNNSLAPGWPASGRSTVEGQAAGCGSAVR